ncbi:MgtC/SapB family protein [Bacillus tianshenii]|nr:MgtC/SapB family protein [Bacillus tianshenii]
MINELNELINQYLGEYFLLMSLRIILAVFLCGIIGFEREIKQHPAGFRTHLLVGVGSCLMMLLSLYGFGPYMEASDKIRFDPARIPSYVISGIGFLGAGTIIVRGATVRGLTTAASIWVVAGLGLIIGAGMYGIAVFTTIVVLFSLLLLNRFEKRLAKVHKIENIHIFTEKQVQPLLKIVAVFDKEEIKVRSIQVKKHRTKPVTTEYIIEVANVTKKQKMILFEKLNTLEGVNEIC